MSSNTTPTPTQDYFAKVQDAGFEQRILDAANEVVWALVGGSTKFPEAFVLRYLTHVFAKTLDAVAEDMMHSQKHIN